MPQEYVIGVLFKRLLLSSSLPWGQTVFQLGSELLVHSNKWTSFTKKLAGKIVWQQHSIVSGVFSLYGFFKPLKVKAIGLYSKLKASTNHSRSALGKNDQFRRKHTNRYFIQQFVHFQCKSNGEKQPSIHAFPVANSPSKATMIFGTRDKFCWAVRKNKKLGNHKIHCRFNYITSTLKQCFSNGGTRTHWVCKGAPKGTLICLSVFMIKF